MMNAIFISRRKYGAFDEGNEGGQTCQKWQVIIKRKSAGNIQRSFASIENPFCRITSPH